MAASDDIMELIRQRGDTLDQSDLDKITMMMVDIPLEDSDQIGWINEAIAQIVNDPDYAGDIAPID